MKCILEGQVPQSLATKEELTGYVPITRVANADANILIEEGRYFIYNATNIPSGQDHGFLETKYFDGTGFAPATSWGATKCYFQTFKRYTGSQYYFRTGMFKTLLSEEIEWSEWKELVNWDNISNPNLLDNWYFANPINQRGVSNGTAGWNDYWIDRWLGACTYAIGTGYITISADGYITQRFEKPVTFPVTASVLTTSGLFLAVFSSPGAIALDGYGWVDIQNAETNYISYHNTASVNIIAAKLELGTEQTLAHQDADGNWVLNDPPPDPAVELLKCQRYYENNWGDTTLYAMTTRVQETSGLASGIFRWRVPKRANPAVQLYSDQNHTVGGVRYQYANQAPQVSTTYSVNAATKEGISFYVPIASAESAATSYFFKYEASADL